nr:dash complex subunit spc19 [Quercus suber]
MGVRRSACDALYDPGACKNHQIGLSTSMESSTSNALQGCVSSLQSSMQLLESSISILDSGVHDYPRLAKVLQTTRVHLSVIPL